MNIFFGRIKKKYGDDLLKGKRYEEMISEIVAQNNEKISRAVGRISNNQYQKQLKKLSADKAKTVKLPDISEVLPKRSVLLIKGAQSGKIISETLKKRLEKDLREVLKEFEGPKMEVQRGRTTGKMKPELVAAFQDKIKETFEGYTKKDPSIGVPGNIRNIAVTETRSTVNAIRDEYVKKLLKKNKNLEMVKTWKHNRKLSKKPRQSHMRLDGQTIPYEDLFKVDNEKTGGFDNMLRPHDPAAPPEQVIGCSCEAIYKARLRKSA